MDWSTILGSVSGGVLGFAGALVTKVVGIFEEKQRHKMRIEELKLSQDIDAQKAAALLEQTREHASGEAFTAAIKSQPVSARSGWAQDAIALFRPGLTLFLLTTSLISAAFVAPDTRDFIVLSLSNMGVTAAGYWFGVRTFEKAPVRK